MKKREATDGDVLYRLLQGTKIKFLVPFLMFIMGIEPIINIREAPSGSVLPDCYKYDFEILHFSSFWTKYNALQ